MILPPFNELGHDWTAIDCLKFTWEGTSTRVFGSVVIYLTVVFFSSAK